MSDFVRSMDGRDLGYIVDFEGRSPAFVYLDQDAVNIFERLHDYESLQVGEHFYTLRDLRKSLACFIPKEEYESMQALL
ncbi:MAG: hypothetical protein HY512_02280 [Candidatus Aenigmarchaeota archaeon]|nr:hypothetical protein [Candidatus Aenigmarchaeota archaeon]